MMKLNNLRKNRALNAVVAICLFFLQSNLVYAQSIENALPAGGVCAAGVCDIKPSGNDLEIVASYRSIIDWKTYNVGRINNVNYSLDGPHLSRVVGTDPSLIYGGINVKGGQLFLVNANGILFGPGSRVDAPGLVASTLDIQNSDFLAGKYNFFQNGKPAYVVNEGQIKITNGGYALLLSNAVSNSGSITADLGSVVLAAGKAMTVALDDAHDVSVTIAEEIKEDVLGPDKAKIKDAVGNAGKISANGGKIVLTAKVLSGIFDFAVNHSGIIEAQSLVDQGGEIELLGDGGSVMAGSNSTTSAAAADAQATGGRIVIKSSQNTIVAKTALLDVSGGSLGGDAGFIEISAKEKLGLYSTHIYTNAAVGFRRGVILIDPRDITIASGGADTPAGDNASSTPDEASGDHAGLDLTIDPLALSSLSASEVYLQATRDVFINDAVDLNTSFKVEADNNITINAGVTTHGQDITLTADADGDSSGGLTMAGGAINSNGGTITLNSGTAIILRSIDAGNGTLFLNPASGGVSQASGFIRTANLVLLGNGTFDLSASSNDADTLSGNMAGDLTLTDSDDLTISTVSSIAGLINLDHDVVINTGNTLTVIKDIKLGTGNLTLNPSLGGVNQISRFIIVAGLLLKGAGDFILNNSSNTIATLAADINGALSYLGSGSLKVGTVGAGSGIKTRGHNLSLKTGSTMTLSADIDVGSAAITFETTAGGSTQSAGKIKAVGLLLKGSGNHTLTASTNDIDTLAGSMTGRVSFTDADDLTIGSLSAIDGLALSGALVLNTSGLLTLAKDIKSKAAMTLNSAAGVIETTGSITNNGSLYLTGDGGFSLTSADNNVGTLAVNIDGDLDYRDSNGLTIGTVAGFSGITTHDHALKLNTGFLSITKAISTKTATITAAGAGQTAAIVADELLLLGTATFNLPFASNDVNTLAVNLTNGALIYTDLNALTVGTVGAVEGITTADKGVTLNTGGTLTLRKDVSIGTVGNLILNASLGGVNQESGKVLAGGMQLKGSGSFSLLSSANDVVRFAADVDGQISYKDASGLNIGTVGAVSGVSTKNNNMQLEAAGLTQTAAIKASGLSIKGNGSFTLNNLANDISILAADVNGSFKYTDSNSMAVGTVGSVDGIKTSNNVLELRSDDMTISSAINTGTSTAQIAQLTNGRAIHLGGKDAGTLGLTSSELDLIRADQLFVGNDLSGTMLVTNDISLEKINTLNLRSGASLEGTSGKTLSAKALDLRAVSGIGVASALRLDSKNMTLKTTAGNIDVHTSATTIDSLSSFGSANIVSSGDLVLKTVSTQNDLTVQALAGDITFDGTSQSDAGAVNVQSDEGSIKAKGDVTHIAAFKDSLLSTPKGVIANPGQKLKVDIKGSLTIDVGGNGSVGADINGTVGLDQPLIRAVNFHVPQRPFGTVFFNGRTLWPTAGTFTVSQESNALAPRFSFPAAEQLRNSQVNVFDPSSSGVQTAPVFLYHPLTQLDTRAFDRDFQLDEGAYDFIEDRIEKREKKKEDLAA